jgi:hypothetical protein
MIPVSMVTKVELFGSQSNAINVDMSNMNIQPHYVMAFSFNITTSLCVFQVPKSQGDVSLYNQTPNRMTELHSIGTARNRIGYYSV